jgi:hypothetical protein
MLISSSCTTAGASFLGNRMSPSIRSISIVNMICDISQALSVILNLNIRKKTEAKATQLSLPQRAEVHHEPVSRSRNTTSASPGSGLTTFGVLTTLVRPITTMFMRSHARTSVRDERDIESQHAQTDNTEENSEHVSEKSRPAEEVSDAYLWS